MGKKIKDIIDKGIKIIEVLICLTILLTLLLSVPNLIRYSIDIVQTLQLRQNPRSI